MQWYNSKTNELQSSPPWSGWLHPDVITEDYSDWQQVEDSFIPPMPLTNKITALRSAINVERDRREMGGFLYLGKRFDSDTTSAIRIGAAVNTAVAAMLTGGEFTVNWTCADNSTISLRAQEFLGLAAALAQHSNMQHSRARGLKEQLEGASTTEELTEVENLLNEWKQEP